MKRQYTVFILLLFLMILAAALIAGASDVASTKHNLSWNGPGTIKTSEGATEICVFCHTPHSANAVPLWNKTNGAGPYSNVYYSDVLGALGSGYPAPEDPSNSGGAGYAVHIKTRLCLSCHDGTIALGNLVNLPYGFSGEIAMNAPGTVDVAGAMPHEAAGYLGVDLRDDHPVAVKYLGPTADPELNDPIGGNVRGYDSVTGNKTTSAGNTTYIECTSCHNAHDNQYGNFLVGPNDGSKICLNCHTKQIGAIANSAHDLASSATYSPPTGGTTVPTVLGNNVAEVKCMTCHFPHKAGITDVATGLPQANPNPTSGTYLLTFQEEMSCFNNDSGDNHKNRWGQVTNVCHGTNATNGSGKIIDIQTEVGKSGGAHAVGNQTGKHQATEGQSAGWFDSNTWHSECADCHNPHTAGNSRHTFGSPTTPPANPFANNSPLYGTSGVNVAFPPGGGAPAVGNYTFVKSTGVTDASTGVNMEYKICLKCHSKYAWNAGTAPTSPSLSAPMTDQGEELNPNNLSFHPVAGAGVNNQGTYLAPWAANLNAQTMYCSDCHNNDTITNAQGPHGSAYQAILYKAYTDSYGPANGGQAQEQPGTDICFDCHDPNQYLRNPPAAGIIGGTGFTTTANLNLHTQHQWRQAAPGNTTVPIPNLKSYRCVNCHIRVTHGWNLRRAMVVFQNDGLPYGASGVAYEAGGAGTGLITGGALATAGTYSTLKGGNCTTVAGCHQ